MSEQNKIDEINAALAAATPGRWHVQPGDYYHAVYSSQDTKLTVVVNRAMPPDARFIAKAPEYITYLLQEIERKDEALRFYADEVNYEEGQSFQDPECGDWFEDPPKVISDDGQRAREAL